MSYPLEETLKVLADSTRLRLLGLLAHGEFTVQELTLMLSMGQSRISRHLRLLSEAGLVTVKRQGTWGYYRIGTANPFFNEIRPSIEEHLEELPARRADLGALSRILEERRLRSKAFFDRYARQWDRLAREILPLPDYGNHLMEVLPSVVRLVEIGVGTGTLLADLRSRAQEIVGVDHSPAMLEEARERIASVGMEGVDLRLGEMSHLPLSDAEAQGALLRMVLHHAPQPTRVLEEIARVLSPGGRLVIADLMRHEKEWTRERMADLWLGFEREELVGWLSAAGFDLESFRCVEGEGDEFDVFILNARLNRKKHSTSHPKGVAA